MFRPVCIAVFLFVLGHAAAQSGSDDIVHGNLIQFMDNGAWSWFQDERAVIDTATGQLFVGAVANQNGVGGSAVDGHVRVTRYDLSSGVRDLAVLGDLESYGAGDDHNLPGLLVKEDGDILAFYAAHNRLVNTEDDRSYYRTFDSATQTWGGESEWHWWDHIPASAPGSGGTTYSNVFQLSAEDANGDGNGRLYNVTRTQQSPHVMYSDDNGATWSYGGQLTKQNATPPSSSYVNGYYKYISNGTDRIDIVATEYHPRDYNTSIYHAYIQGGKLYDSNGNEIDDDIFSEALSFDTNDLTSTDDFTQVFQAGTTQDSRAWNSDIQSYADGSISILFKARDGGFGSHTSGANNQNTWLARFDPNSQTWTNHEIARAGGSLFGGSETDYTGLGALDPSDPNTLYISTEINPIDGQATDHHEIYKGVTGDNGATWSWTAITENSTYDNLRPIVPEWDSQNTALLWWRGEMSNSHAYDTAVTGVLLRSGEETGPVHYVDATTANTARADGQAFNPTVGSSQGPADDNWHVRTGFANGGNLFAAGEVGNEDAPTLKTSVGGLDAGAYDVFAYFWVDDFGDWRILAGLSEDELNLYRQRGAQQAVPDQSNVTFLLEESNRSLYQAYLGRVRLDQGDPLEVFVDASSDNSNTGRAWFDGIGYAAVIAGILGDYNNSGQVEQADLDLVLQNWGDTDISDVTGWTNFAGLPGEGIDGQVDQTELDVVLRNWGNASTPDFSGSSVPEPTGLLAFGLLSTAALGNRNACRGSLSDSNE